MEKRKLLLLSLLLSLFVFYTGCKDSTTEPTPDPVNESQVLATYFESNNDYVYGMASFVISASDVRTNYLTAPDKQLVVDIRSAADFNAKHIKGAVNKTVAELNTYFKTLTLSNYDKVVVACYSGQTSAFAVSLLRAKGYGAKVVSLKWGMSSIDSSFAQNYWLSKIGNTATFVQTAAPAKNAAGDLPKISTTKTDAADILEARVNAVLAEGFTAANLAYSTLSQNFSGYYIVNYWENALYMNPGHLDGATNYPPSTKPFLLSKELKTLPTNKPTVLYCFTGQTSSYVAAYLRLLGYDARTVAYGGNGMIYNLMVTGGVANTFIPANEIKGYIDILE
ncbi:MAG: rhodanese-like domain-containing protein [Ignavibacteria bacterium]|nr:rhodanese-like domain-containing protein [Ignavibacteria bacterium]